MTPLAGLFAAAHVSLASAIQVPEVAMSIEDARTFAVACQNVLRHYSIEATQKTIDIVTLCGVASMLYVPRVVAVVHRIKHGPPRPRQAPGQAFQFQQPLGAGSEPAYVPPGNGAAEGLH